MEEVKKIIIELFTDIAKIHGHNKSFGEIYATIYLADKPLCIDDIVRELGISKGNVSMNLNKLEDMGFIKKVWIKGDRKNYYQCVEGFSSYRDIVEKKYKVISNACDKLEEIYGGSGEDEREIIFKKLEHIKHMKKVSKKILELLKGIED